MQILLNSVEGLEIQNGLICIKPLPRWDELNSMYCSREEFSSFIAQQENLDLELWTADSKENRVVDFVMVKCLFLHVNVSFKISHCHSQFCPAPLHYCVVMALTTTESQWSPKVWAWGMWVMVYQTGLLKQMNNLVLLWISPSPPFIQIT